MGRKNLRLIIKTVCLLATLPNTHSYIILESRGDRLLLLLLLPQDSPALLLLLLPVEI